MKALIGVVVGILALVAGYVAWRTWSARSAQEERIVKFVERTDVAMAARDPRDESSRVLRDLEQVRDLPHDRRLLVAMARLYWRTGKTELAAQKLTEAAQQQSLSADESMLLGRLQERRFCILGDEAAGPLALHSLQRAAAEGNQPAAWYATLRMAARLGNQELAQQIRERLMPDQDSVHARRLRASQALAEGHFEDALRALDDVAGEFDEEAELHLECAQCLLQGATPDLRRARLEIESALRLYPGLVAARSCAAALFHHLGEQALRDNHLDWLIRTQPQHPDRREWESLRAIPAGSAPQGGSASQAGSASRPGTSRPGR